MKKMKPDVKYAERIYKWDNLTGPEKQSLKIAFYVCFASMEDIVLLVLQPWYNIKFYIDRIGNSKDNNHKVMGIIPDYPDCILLDSTLKDNVAVADLSKIKDQEIKAVQVLGLQRKQWSGGPAPY